MHGRRFIVFGTQIWVPWRHVKTYNKLFRSFLPFLLNSALLFLIIVKMIIECKRDQYIIENKVTEWGRQGWRMKTLLLQRCASRKFQVIDVPNTRDQILSDERRSKCEWSNFFLWIPFILLSGSPNECWLYTCDACIIICWRLKLRDTLVACNKVVNNSPLNKSK